MIRPTLQMDPGTEATTAQHLDVVIYLADQNPHRDRSLGITTMTQALLDQFSVRDDIQITQITSTSSFAASGSSIRSKRIPFATDRFLGRLIADGFHPWFVHANADVWYYPKGYAPRYSMPSKPCVGTMHDVIVQYYADHFPGSRSPMAFQYWIHSVRRSLERFQCVLTVSNNAAHQLRSFCDRYSIQPPEIRVTYEGTTWQSYRSLRFNKRNQVIHLASSAPHKRTRHLLEMWRTLVMRGRDLPKLLMVGDVDNETKTLIAKTEGVSLLARMPVEALRDAVGQSLALLLPSEIEGFGLPALESYYVGTPACFVRGTSVEEVMTMGLGGIESMPGGFELEDVDSFSRSLDDVVSLPMHDVRRASDRLYGEFSTERIASRVVSALHDTAGV